MIDEGWSPSYYQEVKLQHKADISFTSDDPVPYHCSGDDPLVIQAEIGGSIIHRIYVDRGSFADIMAFDGAFEGPSIGPSTKPSTGPSMGPLRRSPGGIQGEGQGLRQGLLRGEGRGLQQGLRGEGRGLRGEGQGLLQRLHAIVKAATEVDGCYGGYHI
ncbi:hypothetical protein Tco_1538566, partial [Tanacetum coccineum]